MSRLLPARLTPLGIEPISPSAGFCGFPVSDDPDPSAGPPEMFVVFKDSQSVCGVVIENDMAQSSHEIRDHESGAWSDEYVVPVSYLFVLAFLATSHCNSCSLGASV